MNVKSLIISGVALSSLLLVNTVHAQSGFQNTLNTALGSTFGASDCLVCHVGGLSGATATTPIAVTWRSVGANIALLASSDSDGDGFSNKQEASAKTTEFNDAAVSPFINAVATVSDVKRTNVFVQGDNLADEKVFTAGTANVVVAAGSEVLGGIAVDVYADPAGPGAEITLLYKAGGAATTSTVYAVDTYANTNTLLAATDWTLLANGAVQVKQWPATGMSHTQYDFVVVRITPTANSLLGGDSDSNDDDNDSDDEKNAVACAGVISTTPLWMLFVLLSLGLLIRKKSD